MYSFSSELRVRATGRHLAWYIYEITQCYLPPDTGEHTLQAGRPVLDLPTPGGWKAELT